MKACFKLKQDLFSETNMPIKIYLKMFDSVIKPILLYCCEIWSNEGITSLNLTNLNMPMDSFHNKFCKYLLKVNCKASNMACLLELGRYPLRVSSTIQMIKYWLKVAQRPQDTLINEALKLGKILDSKGIKNWVSGVKLTLNTLNMSNTWNSDTLNNNTTINSVKTNINKLFQNQCKEYLYDDNKGKNHKNKLRTYRQFKEDFGLEKYLNIVKNPLHRAALTKLRISAPTLKIEAGRYIGQKLEDRKCLYCKDNQIEDECHFMLNCNLYNKLRREFCQVFETTTTNKTDTGNLISIMKTNDKQILMDLSKYIFKCFTLRSDSTCLKTNLPAA